MTRAKTASRFYTTQENKRVWTTIFVGLCMVALTLFVGPPKAKAGDVPWPTSHKSSNRISDIDVPAGYGRKDLQADSFGAWLRAVPLKPAGSPVLEFDGSYAATNMVAKRVLDIDVGDRDLQQCADVVIRLWSEYLYAAGQDQKISFKFTSGHAFSFNDYLRGVRPKVDGAHVTFSTSAPAEERSYQTFRRWLKIIFTYAGTASLARDMQKVEKAAALKIGDVLIAPGYPGHTVMVADIAVHEKTGAKRYLLVQGYSPAQSPHIVKTMLGKLWFELTDGSTITPSYYFKKGSYYRFGALVAH